MKANQIRIVSDGTTANTKITTAEGEELRHVRGIAITGTAPGLLEATLQFIPATIDVEAECLEIEALAQVLHESGRAAAEKGATIAQAVHGEKALRFLEWDDLPEAGREGRRMQATYLLQRFHIAPIPQRSTKREP